MLRYLMPAAFVLSIYAGRALVMAWESRRSFVRLGAGGLALAIFLVAYQAQVDARVGRASLEGVFHPDQVRGNNGLHIR